VYFSAYNFLLLPSFSLDLKISQNLSNTASTFALVISLHCIHIHAQQQQYMKYQVVHLNFIVIVSVEESIVNIPLVSQTTQKGRLDLNRQSVIGNPWWVHNRLFKANEEEKFK
jgi:hypothetical protein